MPYEGRAKYKAEKNYSKFRSLNPVYGFKREKDKSFLFRFCLRKNLKLTKSNAVEETTYKRGCKHTSFLKKQTNEKQRLLQREEIP